MFGKQRQTTPIYEKPKQNDLGNKEKTQATDFT